MGSYPFICDLQEAAYLVECPHVESYFGNITVRCTFDSGSNLTVVTQEVWEKSGFPIDLNPKMRVNGVTGETSLYGVIHEACISVDGVFRKLQVYVSQ